LLLIKINVNDEENNTSIEKGNEIYIPVVYDVFPERKS